ncbi:hypothetical protein GCM10011576_41370 [Micromonospora parathelypteridis]|uniref:IS30 family transposase n=1 Tax=Micromonospora parathelypteridis TaxID=1839617 RepID=A0A840W6H5_9ACTN|nr:hypothetical protein [Micromonospora parathelypteridis]MBB5480668.1 IS30 family transposase [Micromonospora parathelypteridis]GGO22243.1 hypothetical protein GCM10011576_41370 [Micromonospora parathelypteridis]
MGRRGRNRRLEVEAEYWRLLGVYDGDLAHARARARQRARRPRGGRLVADTGLRAVIQAKLEEDWSPQQIVAWLRQAFADQPSISEHAHYRRACQRHVRAGSQRRRAVPAWS